MKILLLILWLSEKSIILTYNICKLIIKGLKKIYNLDEGDLFLITVVMSMYIFFFIIPIISLMKNDDYNEPEFKTAYMEKCMSESHPMSKECQRVFIKYYGYPEEVFK